MSNQSQVTGRSFSFNQPDRAFIWEAGETTLIQPPKNGIQPAFLGLRINSTGSVLGQAPRRLVRVFVHLWFVTDDSAPGGARIHTVLWQSRVITNLGDLPGGRENSMPLDINRHAEIVGTGESDEVGPIGQRGRAVLWCKGVPYDLNSLIAAADPLAGEIFLEIAHAINDDGLITARGQSVHGERPPAALTS